MTEQSETRPVSRPQAAQPRRWAVPSAGPFGLAAGGLGTFGLALGATFEREIDGGRGFLWLPVAFGIGILIYFALPHEPALWACRRHRRCTCVRRVASALGERLPRSLSWPRPSPPACLAAKARTDLVAAPVIAREMTATVTGWISAVEETTRGGKRVRIAVATIERLKPEATPALVRVTINTRADALAVGDADYRARPGSVRRAGR